MVLKRKTIVIIFSILLSFCWASAAKPVQYNSNAYSQTVYDVPHSDEYDDLEVQIQNLSTSIENTNNRIANTGDRIDKIEYKVNHPVSYEGLSGLQRQIANINNQITNLNKTIKILIGVVIILSLVIVCIVGYLFIIR